MAQQLHPYACGSAAGAGGCSSRRRRHPGDCGFYRRMYRRPQLLPRWGAATAVSTAAGAGDCGCYRRRHPGRTRHGSAGETAAVSGSHSAQTGGRDIQSLQIQAQPHPRATISLGPPAAPEFAMRERMPRHPEPLSTDVSTATPAHGRRSIRMGDVGARAEQFPPPKRSERKQKSPPPCGDGLFRLT